MRSAVHVFGCLLVFAGRSEGEDLAGRLERVVAAADTFVLEAPRYVGLESLKQQAIVLRGNFRRRPETVLQTREIESEYGFSSFSDSPGVLREFRQPRSVDGRALRTPARARETLVEGMVSKDERLKRQLLRDFAALGLEGTIADFGQSLALFRRDRIKEYEFGLGGTARLGADKMIRLTFRQRAGSEGLTIFEGKRAIHVPLTGELWLRESDSTPLRVVIASVRKIDKNSEVRDETAVDYAPAARGVLLPASVVHRQWENGQPVLEDVFTYSRFQRFSVESSIKFE